jgi:pectate lyase
MKNKNLIILIVSSVVMLILGFFGGMQYQKTKLSKFTSNFTGNGSRNQVGQQGQRNGGFNQVRGTVLSKDEKSMTVKLQDNSSKIVLITDSTQINKVEKGILDDITVGEEVSVFGNTNSDGSVTADNVQVGLNIMPKAQ